MGVQINGVYYPQLNKAAYEGEEQQRKRQMEDEERTRLAKEMEWKQATQEHLQKMYPAQERTAAAQATMTEEEAAYTPSKLKHEQTAAEQEEALYPSKKSEAESRAKTAGVEAQYAEQNQKIKAAEAQAILSEAKTRGKEAELKQFANYLYLQQPDKAAQFAAQSGLYEKGTKITHSANGYNIEESGQPAHEITLPALMTWLGIRSPEEARAFNKRIIENKDSARSLIKDYGKTIETINTQDLRISDDIENNANELYANELKTAAEQAIKQQGMVFPENPAQADELVNQAVLKLNPDIVEQARKKKEEYRAAQHLLRKNAKQERLSSLNKSFDGQASLLYSDPDNGPQADWLKKQLEQAKQQFQEPLSNLEPASGTVTPGVAGQKAPIAAYGAGDTGRDTSYDYPQ